MDPQASRTLPPSTSPPRLLVVDDDAEHLRALTRLLSREGFDNAGAPTAAAAIAEVRRHSPDLVLTDLMMPDVDGLGLIASLREQGCDADVVVMTAFGTVERAVEAMRHGAADFIVKPLQLPAVLQTLRRTLAARQLRLENVALRADLARARGITLVGTDPRFVAALQQLRRVAQADATVLLHGESGTGKELFARELHARSGRAAGPFVALDCGSLPLSLAEAELFGHEEGAFTGATRRRIGRIEAAHGGTLLLDEVGELPPELQVKLLRVLQERELVRVGATTPTPVDVRVVAATHRDLAQRVAEGSFRADLYYRLNVVSLTLPALRERPDDIVPLAEAFIAQLAPGRERPRLTGPARVALRTAPWPGNVRELRNALERAVVLDVDGQIDVDDLGPAVRAPAGPEVLSFSVGTPLAEVERRMIEATLAACGGDKSEAATRLGVARRTIYRRVDEYRGVTTEGGDDGSDG